MKNKLLKYSSVCLIFLCALVGCNNGININDEVDTVEEVIDGGTIKLGSGLTVHLLGISPDNVFCKEYMTANLIGKDVLLTLDSYDEPEIDSYDSEVNAYVSIASSGESLNRKLLMLAGERAYYPAFMSDSLDVFNKIFPGPRSILTDNELAAKLKACSMLVYGSDGSMSFIGTAFFINENGLAITNNHVLNHGNRYCFYISDSQGNIDFGNAYPLKRIVETSDYRTGPDYTIFYVDIDDDTQKRLSYLTVSDYGVVSGDKIATVGNPSPGTKILTMSYASGTVSAIRKEDNTLQINAPITHGFSGGALVNGYGEVVGISSSGYDNNNANLNFAVDFKVVRERLDKLNIPYAGR